MGILSLLWPMDATRQIDISCDLDEMHCIVSLNPLLTDALSPPFSLQMPPVSTGHLLDLILTRYPDSVRGRQLHHSSRAPWAPSPLIPKPDDSAEPQTQPIQQLAGVTRKIHHAFGGLMAQKSDNICNSFFF